MKRAMYMMLFVTLVSGCMQAGIYQPGSNTVALKQYKGSKLVLATLDLATSYNSSCRLLRSIEPGNGLTITQYIQNAFNDEFKLANLYDNEQGVKITGRLDKIEFSSFSGWNSGWWDIGITLQSPNGRTLSVKNRYNFKIPMTSYGSYTACDTTAQALTPAVQGLINKTINDPMFAMLLM